MPRESSASTKSSSSVGPCLLVRTIDSTFVRNLGRLVSRCSWILNTDAMESEANCFRLPRSWLRQTRPSLPTCTAPLVSLVRLQTKERFNQLPERETMTIDELFKSASHGCSVPNCNCNSGPIYLHARCHPNANVTVSVDARAGKMEIACAVCEQAIVTINHTMSN